MYLKVKESNSGVATRWILEGLQAPPKTFRSSKEHLALSPACPTLQGGFLLVSRDSGSLEFSHLLEVPLGRGGIIMGSWVPPGSWARCQVLPRLPSPGRAAGERTSHHLLPQSILLPTTHESSFLFPQSQKHVHRPGPREFSSKSQDCSDDEVCGHHGFWE